MTNYRTPVELVTEFHKTYGQRINEEPTLDVPERKMRVALIVEESEEYAHAEATDDLIEIADALGDLVYVVVGAALTHGFDIQQYRSVNLADLSIQAPKAPTLDIPTRKTWVALVERLVGEYSAAEQADDFDTVKRILGTLVDTCYAASKSHGIDLDVVLAEIQASNMSKLDENGKPIYREDGKVLKGKNFFVPNIDRVLKEQGWLG